MNIRDISLPGLSTLNNTVNVVNSKSLFADKVEGAVHFTNSSFIFISVNVQSAIHSPVFSFCSYLDNVADHTLSMIDMLPLPGSPVVNVAVALVCIVCH